MEKYINELGLEQMTVNELKLVNGGGILRKYGEYLGKKVGGILVYLAVALVTKKIIG